MARRRNALFKDHPASPLDAAQRAAFRALAYYDYDPAWRLEGRVTGVSAVEQHVVDLGADGRLAFGPVATVTFDAPAGPARLTLFWIAGYGGGLFLPFQDQTNGQQTYGGGRYLYDTIKGADLGAGPERICLDFNFAYNPSCAYHPRWVCPLSPPENRLPFAVPAGERSFGLSAPPAAVVQVDVTWRDALRLRAPGELIGLWLLVRLRPSPAARLLAGVGARRKEAGSPLAVE